MEISVREAKAVDFDAVYGLLKSEMGYININEDALYKRLERIMGSSGYKTFVAVADEKTVGVIGLCRMLAFENEKDYILIIVLASKAEYQNKGVGTRLIKAAEDYARSEGLETLSVTSGLTRGNAHRFYESRGYEKNGYRFKRILRNT